MVSVVIPTYRGGPYLREAVSSVLAQSLRDLELVVVADGCADDLADLEGLDDRIVVIRQANRGASVARNVGVRAARSDLVAFLDDDDRMLPGRLAAQARAMRGRPEAVLCHTQFREIDAAGASGKLGHACDVQYQDLLAGQIHVLMPTTMMRRHLMEELGGFDPALPVVQDLDMIYRLARDGPLVFLPAVLTEYRQHGGNISADLHRSALDALSIIAKHRRLAELDRDDERAVAARTGSREMRHLGAGAAIDASRRSWHAGQPRQAIRGMVAALSLSPRHTLVDLWSNRKLVLAARSFLVSHQRRFRS